MDANRRQFLRKTITASVAATGLSSVDVLFQPNLDHAKKQWNLFTFIPNDFPLWGKALKSFAQNLYNSTNGEFTVAVYNLYNATNFTYRSHDVVKLVSENQYTVGHFSPSSFSAMDSAVHILSHLPMGPEGQRLDEWVTHANKLGINQRLFSSHGVQFFPFGVVDQSGLWADQEIESLSDLQSMKVRCFGLAQDVLQNVGGRPTLTDFDRINQDLASGGLNAVEGLSPYIDMERGLHQLGLRYYMGGWPKKANVMGLFVNSTEFMKLDEDERKAFGLAAKMGHSELTKQSKLLDKSALETIREQNIVHTFPRQVEVAFENSTNEVLTTLAEESNLFAEVYSEYKQFC